MSSILFDSGDMQRLDREKSLTEQAPRQLPVEDRPQPSSILSMDEPEEDNGDKMLEKILAALKKRL